MQVYRGMDVGTAKPRPEERQAVPHHLLDVVAPDEEFNAALYRSHALRVLQDIRERGKVAFVVGGTGLYLKALVFGILDMPSATEEERARKNGELAAIVASAKRHNPVHGITGMLVFGSGCALAGLAGVIGGVTFVTEPSMATIVGSIIFVVVVVGGMGSLAGAFVASILIGLLQTLPLTVDKSLVHLAANLGWSVAPGDLAYPLMKITLAQAAPILPYLLLVLILIFRPKGLLGTREG